MVMMTLLASVAAALDAVLGCIIIKIEKKKNEKNNLEFVAAAAADCINVFLNKILPSSAQAE